MGGGRLSRTPVSLRWRLLLAALGGLVVALSAAAWGVSAAFEATVRRSFDERLKTVLQTLVAETETTADARLRLSRPLGDPRFDTIYSGSYWQVSDASGVLLRSRSLWDQEIPFAIGPPDGSTQFRTWTNPAGQRVRLAERDLTLPGRDAVVHFIVGGRTDDFDAELRTFDGLLLGGVALLMLLSGGAVAFQVRVGLRPLRDLLGDVESVWQGRQSRVRESLPAELRRLAVAVNHLLDHDDRRVERARGQAADLAHAIKTPLAVLATDLARIDSPLTPGMRDCVDRIDALVTRNLARAAVAGAGVGALGVALRPAAGELVALMGRVYPDRSIETSIGIPDGLHARIDRQDLEELLGNLLDNAWKWARGRVRIAAEKRGARVRLTIEDDGPGLAPAERTAVLGRRVRLDEQVPGQGLGLAIALDIVTANQGSLELGATALGGLAVVIELPAARTD
ncbi:MAG: sensor histidine kinase [Steroidobacteraceae bacterium]|nr:sensor histidine kinase [Steroidobacteraceae bacterium]